MITGLVVKCFVLIGIIHGLRILSRRIGPRGSGLILGLPSSTAILLVIRGWENGPAGATEMAEASLLGLIAAIALPLAYAQAVRLGWPLAGALPSAVACYVIVALGLGYLPSVGAVTCLAISSSAIMLASCLAGGIRLPRGDRVGVAWSERWTAIVRTAIPAAYVILVGILGSAASPTCAGLASTFPSMTVALLAVTHLEEGPTQASQIAKTLPLANLSTVAFLAAFRFGCPALGLGWGTLGGYATALISTAAIEVAAWRVASSESVRGERRRWESLTRGVRPSPRRAGIRTAARAVPRHIVRLRPAYRGRFAPRVEALPC